MEEEKKGENKAEQDVNLSYLSRLHSTLVAAISFLQLR
jgi:hypothetical protein